MPGRLPSQFLDAVDSTPRYALGARFSTSYRQVSARPVQRLGAKVASGALGVNAAIFARSRIGILGLPQITLTVALSDGRTGLGSDIRY